MHLTLFMTLKKILQNLYSAVALELLGSKDEFTIHIVFVNDVVAFPRKDQVCRLGIFLALALLMDKQVAVVDRSAFSQLWSVH